MQTPDPSEVAKLPAHKDRKDWPFAGRPAMPSSRKCPVDGTVCFNHYCRMQGGSCIQLLPPLRDDNRDERFIRRDMVALVAIVITAGVAAMLIGWLFTQ